MRFDSPPGTARPEDAGSGTQLAPAPIPALTGPLSEQVRSRIPEAAGRYYRLLLLVGPPRSGKTSALRELADSEGWPLLNVNLLLSERLLDLTSKQRAVRVPKILGGIVRKAGSKVVLLDNIEILFSAELAQDPLRLLQGLSRNRVIVAAWPGTFDGDRLSYAEPGHPEARSYRKPDAVIVRADASHPRLASRVSGRESEEAT